MNCAKAREMFAVQLNADNLEVWKHLEQCDKCQEFAEPNLKLNRELNEAFNIEVPKKLKSILIVAQIY